MPPAFGCYTRPQRWGAGLLFVLQWEYTVTGGCCNGVGSGIFYEQSAAGVGLAMDAFSVSMANGLRQPEMSRKRMAALPDLCRFQAAMPLAGGSASTPCWRHSRRLRGHPLIALVLLGYIGGKMLWEAARRGGDRRCGVGFDPGRRHDAGRGYQHRRTVGGLYHCGSTAWLWHWCAALIAAVTFVLCYAASASAKIRHQAGGQGICAGRRDPHRHRAGDLCNRGVLSQNKRSPRCLWENGGGGDRSLRRNKRRNSKSNSGADHGSK